MTPRHRGEQGMALVAVMVTSVVLSILAAVVVAYGTGSQNISRYDQNWNGALAAAEAGIDDYLFRLNENSNYWVYDADNPPPEPPAGDGNQAFSDWVPVAGGGTESEYRYDIDASSLGADGRIRISSTGRVRDSTRIVEATLRRRSFLDYLYFTDYETIDPALYPIPLFGLTFTAAQAHEYCSRHFYGGSGIQRDINGRVDFPGDLDSSGRYCIDIQFGSFDEVNGPLHTNDAFLVCGSPRFNGDTSTSWNPSSGLRYRVNSSCGAAPPSFANAGDPAVVSPLTMPPSNSAIRAETEPGLGGCLYTGPTSIVLNANGTMTVSSPFSKETNGTNCPTAGTGSLPSNGVVFVQGVPSDPVDPNYTSGCPYFVNGRNHPLGYPITNDNNSYGCRDGDALVEGTLDGQLTIAAENDVVVTWHLRYKDGLAGDDLLGLVANNMVEVYHPTSCNAATYTTSCNLTHHGGQRLVNPEIHAAILSVNHSFQVQRWDRGAPLGTLNVTGAIAQRYRGVVALSSGSTLLAGYAKNYVYDQRLQYLSPPKFLDPVQAAWGVATWAEGDVPAAYR